jgi:RHS repeat-associated protein
LPNGLTTAYQYGTLLQDEALQKITHKVGATPVSEFTYTRDIPKGRIDTWTQQAGTEAAIIHTFGYDLANQLAADAVTAGATSTGSYGYSYDAAGNRLSEQIDANPAVAFHYNGLNELTTQQPSLLSAATYRWDGANRLIEVNAGSQTTQFSYDGLGRRVAIRQLVNGSETALRRFIWSGKQIWEERDAAGAVTKRFYDDGVKLESGASAGSYFYTRDHLGSVREMVDTTGTVRVRNNYDPFGHRVGATGSLSSDFGYAGMFWSPEASLNLTYYRAYEPNLGRWLSRDPLPDAELEEAVNLYVYVRNNPISNTDPLGLCCEKEKEAVADATLAYVKCIDSKKTKKAEEECGVARISMLVAVDKYNECVAKGCKKKPPKKCPSGK